MPPPRDTAAATTATTAASGRAAWDLDAWDAGNAAAISSAIDRIGVKNIVGLSVFDIGVVLESCDCVLNLDVVAQDHVIKALHDPAEMVNGLDAGSVIKNVHLRTAAPDAILVLHDHFAGFEVAGDCHATADEHRQRLRPIQWPLEYLRILASPP